MSKKTKRKIKDNVGEIEVKVRSDGQEALRWAFVPVFGVFMYFYYGFRVFLPPTIDYKRKRKDAKLVVWGFIVLVTLQSTISAIAIALLQFILDKFA